MSPIFLRPLMGGKRIKSGLGPSLDWPQIQIGLNYCAIMTKSPSSRAPPLAHIAIQDAAVGMANACMANVWFPVRIPDCATRSTHLLHAHQPEREHDPGIVLVFLHEVSYLHKIRCKE